MGNFLREVKRVLEETLKFSRLEGAAVLVREDAKHGSHYRVLDRTVVISRFGRQSSERVISYPTAEISFWTLASEAPVLLHELGHHVSFRRLGRKKDEEITKISYTKLVSRQVLSPKESLAIMREETRAWRIGWRIATLLRASFLFKFLFLLSAFDKLSSYFFYLVFFPLGKIAADAARSLTSKVPE